MARASASADDRTGDSLLPKRPLLRYLLVFEPAPGVWSFPVTGGEATQLVAFDDPSLSIFEELTIGADHFYLTISEYESDIWVMDLEY